MFPAKHYVPILKGKEGEFIAIEKTSTPAIKLITPLIELMNFIPKKLTPAQAIKRRKEMPTMDTHITNSISAIIKCWNKTDRIFIDFNLITVTNLYAISPSYVMLVFRELYKNGIKAVPVVYHDNDVRFVEDVKKINKDYNTGIVVRLRPIEMVSGVFLDKIISTYGIDKSAIDLILDFQSIIDENIDTLVTSAQIFINDTLDEHAKWRSLTVSSAAFPVDLSGFAPGAIYDLSRNDWFFWNRLKGKSLKRIPSYSDYSIAHPQVSTFDIVPDVSASIRYTSTDKWIILRGSGTKKIGWEPIRRRCKELIKMSEYDGASFSWGDKYIEDCANNLVGTGGAPMWRKVINNRHLEKTCSQISSLSGI